MKKPNKEEKLISELALKVSAACEGHSKKIVASALLTLVSSIIADSAKTLPDAMTSASIAGLKMMDNVRIGWDGEKPPEGA